MSKPKKRKEPEPFSVLNPDLNPEPPAKKHLRISPETTRMCYLCDSKTKSDPGAKLTEVRSVLNPQLPASLFLRHGTVPLVLKPRVAISRKRRVCRDCVNNNLKALREVLKV